MTRADDPKEPATGARAGEDQDTSQDDLDWFQREMRDVRPLRAEERAVTRPPPPPPRPRQREADERRVMQELLLDPEPVEGLETGEELLFLRPGYQKRILRKLRRGQFVVQDHLDLHHMTEAVARHVLLEFIEQTLAAGLSCVRIVHGKGLRSRTRPKLKMMTNRLLRRHPAVVAFASCRPVDGGTGAVNVLLRPR